MNASERTLKWCKEHPERAMQNLKRTKERRQIANKEALLAIKKSRYKTPMQAIKGFCRNCSFGISRKGKNYLNALVSCEKRKCPLFAFRNGNPACIKRGYATNMSIVRKKVSNP